MGEVLIKAGALVLIIVLGYGLKRAGFFKVTDFTFLSKVVINLTLPGAIVTNFSKISFEAQLLWLVVIGIACYNEFDPGKTQRNCVAQRLKPKLQ